MWHLVFTSVPSARLPLRVYFRLCTGGDGSVFAYLPADWNCVDWIRLSRGIIKDSKSLQNCRLSNGKKEAVPHQCGRRWHRRVIAVDILHLSSGHATKMSYSARQVSILFYDFSNRALHCLCTVCSIHASGADAAMADVMPIYGCFFTFENTFLKVIGWNQISRFVSDTQALDSIQISFWFVSDSFGHISVIASI